MIFGLPIFRCVSGLITLIPVPMPVRRLPTPMPVMPPSDRLVLLHEMQRTRAGSRIPELIPRYVFHPSLAGRLHCPKCDGTMNLARQVRTPSGFDIRTFECTSCDHAQIVRAAPDLPTEVRSPNEVALDALEEARRMAPGPQRSMALKKAGLLRRTADDLSVISRRSNLRTHGRSKP